MFAQSIRAYYCQTALNITYLFYYQNAVHGIFLSTLKYTTNVACMGFLYIKFHFNANLYSCFVQKLELNLFCKNVNPKLLYSTLLRVTVREHEQLNFFKECQTIGHGAYYMISNYALTVAGIRFTVCYPQFPIVTCTSAMCKTLEHKFLCQTLSTNVSHKKEDMTTKICTLLHLHYTVRCP